MRLQVKSKSTTLEAAERQEKRNTLHHRIENWRNLQDVYKPGVLQLRNSKTAPAVSPVANPPTRSTRSKHRVNPNADVPELPEDECLWLPSSIPCEHWVTVGSLGLVAKETKYRVAQADDALTKLRCQLRICAILRDYKKTQIGGTSQRMATRAHSMLLRFGAKINRCAERYRATYATLTLLDPNGEWTSHLQVLKDTDPRSPHREQDDPSEGHRELSWIWLAGHASGRPTHATGDELNQSESIQTDIIKIQNLLLFSRYACRVGQIESTCATLA